MSDPLNLVIDLLNEVRTEQIRIASIVDTMQAAGGSHATECHAMHMRLLSAFPGDDVEGHARYHKAVIERIELRNQVVRAAMTKVLSWGTIAGTVWVLVALWNAFKSDVAGG